MVEQNEEPMANVEQTAQSAYTGQQQAETNDQ